MSPWRETSVYSTSLVPSGPSCSSTLFSFAVTPTNSLRKLTDGSALQPSQLLCCTSLTGRIGSRRCRLCLQHSLSHSCSGSGLHQTTEHGRRNSFGRSAL